MIYLFIIFFNMTLIFLGNLFFNPTYSWYIYLLYTVILTILVIVVDGIVAWIIRSLPEKYFDYHKKIFQSSPKKLKFYESLGVKKWKDKVPELGMFTNFRKNKISDPNNPKYLKRYILEACYGIIIHYVSVPFSFIIMLCDMGIYSGNANVFLTIALPVAITNAVLILLPAFILKYNIVKLIRIYEIKENRIVSE